MSEFILAEEDDALYRVASCVQAVSDGCCCYKDHRTCPDPDTGLWVVAFSSVEAWNDKAQVSQYPDIAPDLSLCCDMSRDLVSYARISSHCAIQNPHSLSWDDTGPWKKHYVPQLPDLCALL